MRLAALAFLVLATPSWGQVTSHGTKTVRHEMALIPAGTVQPLYGNGPVSVRSFLVDRQPVTRAQYIAFTAANPKWVRETVIRTGKADNGYLDWSGDKNSQFIPASAVTWDGANAYCQTAGKRLPTPAEWEYVAGSRQNGKEISQSWLIKKYTSRSAGASLEGTTTNMYGVRGLHERLWEIVLLPFGASREIMVTQHNSSVHADHMFCASAAEGAHDARDYAAFMRYGARASVRDPHQSLPNFGFRCASSM